MGSRGREGSNDPVSNREKECSNPYGPKLIYRNAPWRLRAGVKLPDDVSRDLLIALEAQAHAAAIRAAHQPIKPSVRPAMAYRCDAGAIIEAVLAAIGYHGVIVREPEPAAAV